MFLYPTEYESVFQELGQLKCRVQQLLDSLGGKVVIEALWPSRYMTIDLY